MVGAGEVGEEVGGVVAGEGVGLEGLVVEGEGDALVEVAVGEV